jgi:hypothetical protein
MTLIIFISFLQLGHTRGFTSKRILRTTKPVLKYKKAELIELLFSSGFEIVEDCYFPVAIGVLAKNMKS